MHTFRVSIYFITNLDDQLARRLPTRQIDLGLLHTFSSERVFTEDVDHDTFARHIEGGLKRDWRPRRE